ncbi:nucleoside recognition domain-containing protein [Haliea sp. E1-2-M8]|uniref:nucleoside recognition domain-containing protein n=1 Tax=Haliea sp. E1-2-M8 TaxID=3064706 RepID=UPI00271DFC71|nr:spore maturation protein [Haliea sp. E1-2-M8]MDO8860826.1 nucleoside recognition domain-containing protein [Haliea sp. E1-2-M8]
MLHRIWLGFFLIAFASALFQWLVAGDAEVFQRMVASLFDMAGLAVQLAIGLIGLMALWLGVVAIGEASGLVDKLARLLSPLFVRLMPDVPRGHPAISSMTLNLSANVLGLDNAATPLGIKAMKDLQELNPNPTVASNAQILFLVLNTSSVTLFPVTVLLYRAQMGAPDPAAVFIPILIATSCSTLAGLLVTAWVQRINLRDTVVLACLGGGFALLLALVGWFSTLTASELQRQSSLLSNLLIISLIILFLVVAHRRAVNVYETFIEGAKQGFETAIGIIPYLLAMLVAIGVFRASGALELVLEVLRAGVGGLGFDTRWVEAMPTALMKPLSGSGARAMMIDTMNTYGVDSFQGRLAATMQGSTETTFYTLAVYFGAVGIRHARHALACGLVADAAGITAAIVVAYWFYT